MIEKLFQIYNFDLQRKRFIDCNRPKKKYIKTVSYSSAGMLFRKEFPITISTRTDFFMVILAIL
jgi:hypothetical protein